MNRLVESALMTTSVAMSLAVSLTTSGCHKKDAPTGAAPAGRGGARGPKQASFPVEVLEIDARPHELLVTAPGVVDAFEHVQVTARVSGVVDKVSFAEGQDVKAGQALALVDSRRYALAVSSAKAALEKASATAADSEASLKRRQNAVENNPGLIPGEELETYTTRLRTAHADVDGAREALKLAALNLDDSTVKAATDGIIQTRTVQTGQYVQAGTVIATLLRRDPMLLRFSVTTAEAPRLKVGMMADFTLKESQATYQAKITLVSGAADPESRLVPVTAEIASDKKFWLRPGSFATVQMKLASQRQFPMIPQGAARPSERGFLAYVVEGDVAHERTLQLGLHTTDGFVEVRSGLNAGDHVVVRGVEALAEGTKVRIAKVPGSGSVAAAAPKGSPESPAEGAPPVLASAAAPERVAAGSGPPHDRRKRPPGAPSAATNAEAP